MWGLLVVFAILLAGCAQQEPPDPMTSERCVEAQHLLEDRIEQARDLEEAINEQVESHNPDVEDSRNRQTLRADLTEEHRPVIHANFEAAAILAEQNPECFTPGERLSVEQLYRNISR